MAKTNFSSAVGASLNGREQPKQVAQTTKPIPSVPASVTPDVSPAPAKPKPQKKSAAGRKKMDASQKRKQLVVTISPDTYNKLISWAETKPRTATHYLSDYIDEHIDDIID